MPDLPRFLDVVDEQPSIGQSQHAVDNRLTIDAPDHERRHDESISVAASTRHDVDSRQSPERRRVGTTRRDERVHPGSRANDDALIERRGNNSQRANDRILTNSPIDLR
jgi:hypothetical protein